LFCFLAVWAYTGYAARGGKGRYIGSLALFTSALLSKPMAVTLPFLLLLLDFWPLGRLGTFPAECGKSDARVVPARLLLFEKIPLFLLSAVSCVVTYAAQKSGGAVNTGLEVPMGVRLSNALVAYAMYLGKTVWPGSLSVFYPHPWEASGGIIPTWHIVSAVPVVAGMSALSLWRLRTHPYLAVGWFSYLGMLVPVIGVIEVGRQAMADRYTYMPLIGVFILVSWGIPELLARRRFGRQVLIAGGCAVLLALTFASRIQASYWRDDIALFGHAAEVDPDNAFAHNSIGIALRRQGRPLEAIARFERALSTGYSSHTVDALTQMGLTFFDLGMLDMAAGCFQRGLAITSDDPKLRFNLSEVFFRQGKIDDAVREMEEAARLDPSDQVALRRLDEMRPQQGRESLPTVRP
jgi:tetratricopeptide (TPR) repeat protein